MTINCNGKLVDLSIPKIMGILNLTPDSFYDGGYYYKAMQELEIIENPLCFSNTKNTIEYWYRKGRVSQKLAKPTDEIISFFVKTLEIARHTTAYFVPMSALQIGIEHEKNGDYERAKSFYNQCLSMKGFDYERGIHQKAKAGLNRIAN